MKEWIELILTAIATGALVWTLIYVAKYTKATKEMADATIRMASIAQASAKAALEAEKIRRQPVVQVSCDPQRQREFYFRTLVANRGSGHAKLRVLATIEVDGVGLALMPNHRYNGVRIWNLHAGHGITGHLDFEGVFKHNDFKVPDGRRAEVKVTLKSWVIHYNDPVSWLDSDEAKMPTSRYTWSGPFMKGAEGQWVPDPAEPFDV